jgi:hypothetical protein
MQSCPQNTGIPSAHYTRWVLVFVHGIVRRLRDAGRNITDRGKWQSTDECEPTSGKYSRSPLRRLWRLPVFLMLSGRSMTVRRYTER